MALIDWNLEDGMTVEEAMAILRRPGVLEAVAGEGATLGTYTDSQGETCNQVKGPTHYKVPAFLSRITSDWLTKEAIAADRFLVPMPGDHISLRDVCGPERFPPDGCAFSWMTYFIEHQDYFADTARPLDVPVYVSHEGIRYVSPEGAAAITRSVFPEHHKLEWDRAQNRRQSKGQPRLDYPGLPSDEPEPDPEPVELSREDKVRRVMLDIRIRNVSVRMTRRGFPYVRDVERLAGVDISSQGAQHPLERGTEMKEIGTYKGWTLHRGDGAETVPGRAKDHAAGRC